MKSIYINICIISFFVTGIKPHAFSQTDDLNHKKYWYYRSRLVNDFMKIGPNPGESMPFSHRYENSNPAGLMGADAVSNLGTYLCAITTEYFMIRSNSQPYNYLTEEIFYALDAFNRLDQQAEVEWNWANNQTNLNGFFIRQDMPCDFVINNLEHFNFDLQTIPNPPIITYPPQGTTPSGVGGFCSTNFMWNNDEGNEAYCNHTNNPGNNTIRADLAMSVDQTIPILAACALINKFIPVGSTYVDDFGQTHHFRDGTTDIRNEARAIAVRIINNLKKNAGWIIQYPNGGTIPNSKGGDAIEWSFPIAEAVCKINKLNSYANSLLSCVNYQNATSITAGQVLWLAETGIYYPIVDDATKVAWLEATCNCDYTFINTTSTTMLINANGHDFDWAPFLRQILHGGLTTYNTSKVNSLINDAPACGPYNLGSGHYPTVKWSTTDNIEHPERRGKDPDAGTFGTAGGEFNGVDYLLYHNLYYIAQAPGSYFPYQKDIRAFLTGPNYPHAPAITGSISTPETVNALEYINSKALLNNGGNNNNTASVTFRAGKEITLLDGFEVRPGAEFHAFIQRFQCHNNNNTYTRELNSTVTSDYFQSDFQNELPNQEPNYEYLNQVHQMQAEAMEDTLQLSTMFGLESFDVYPNPNNGKFKIEFTLNEGEKASVYITDIIGNTIFKQEALEIGALRVDFDMTEQPKGVYFVNLKTTLGRNEIRKISIQ